MIMLTASHHLCHWWERKDGKAELNLAWPLLLDSPGAGVSM